MPEEDGFYMFEQQNPLFVFTYYQIWAELEKAGTLKYFVEDGFVMVENAEILKQVRAKLKLRNPNIHLNKTDWFIIKTF